MYLKSFCLWIYPFKSGLERHTCFSCPSPIHLLGWGQRSYQAGISPKGEIKFLEIDNIKVIKSSKIKWIFDTFLFVPSLRVLEQILAILMICPYEIIYHSCTHKISHWYWLNSQSNPIKILRDLSNLRIHQYGKSKEALQNKIHNRRGKAKGPISVLAPVSLTF